MHQQKKKSENEEMLFMACYKEHTKTAHQLTQK